MTLLYPNRTIATWLRSGFPFLGPNLNRPDVKHDTLTEGTLKVPMMCHLGTKEGVTKTDDRFSQVWSANKTFFDSVRTQGGLIGIAVDP